MLMHVRSTSIHTELDGTHMAQIMLIQRHGYAVTHQRCEQRQLQASQACRLRRPEKPVESSPGVGVDA